MAKSNVSTIIKSVGAAMRTHSLEILTGIGIVGMITTTVMAVRATPKALALIDEKKKEIGEDKLTAARTVKVAWKCYIPSAVTGVASVACLIGAGSANARRNAALAAAYTISDSAFKEYKKKVVETVGDKKEQDVRDAIAKDKVEHNPVSNCEVIITEKGNTLCYDVLSGRYFKSDIELLKRAVNETNRDLLSERFISLNDFYYNIGLTETTIGRDIGWCVDDGFIDLNFSSQLAEDGTPCLVLNYIVAPRYDYLRR
ncbi:hypothetical protein AGMMS49975_12410 [Clostridia bacterium]|nr:hypothetical protein AGMMS49975_12410 [Clostridia bacterium]